MWIAFGLIGAGLAVSWLLRVSVEHTFDARLEAVALSVLATLEVDSDNGEVTLARPPGDPAFERLHSGWYWQVSDQRGVQLRSRSLWNSSLEVAPPTGAGSRSVVILNGPADAAVRTLVRDITAPGGADVLRLAVGGPQAAIDAEARTLTWVLWAALGAIGIGLIGAVLIQTTLGLRPFARLQRELNAVREGKRDQVAGDTFAEIQPLISDLNALLAQNASILARARMHAGNLAHSLKTPLSVVAAAAAKPGRDPDHTIAESVAGMERLIRHHLRRARTAAAYGVPGARTDVAAVVSELQNVLSKIHAERKIGVEMSAAGPAMFAGERQDLEEMFGNLLDNAYKWARSRIRISVEREASRVLVTIGDDGPGLSGEQSNLAVLPGKRLDSSVPGDGFGLAIVQELVNLYAGKIALTRSVLGGLEVRLDLPAAD